MNILTFDTETTGFDRIKDHAITVGLTISKFEDGQGMEVLGKEEFIANWNLINNLRYPYEFGEEARSINKITDREIALNGSHPIKMYSDMLDFIHSIVSPLDYEIFEDGALMNQITALNVVNGFNLPFDMNMLLGDIEEAITATFKEYQFTRGEGFSQMENARALMYTLRGKSPQFRGGKLVRGKELKSNGLLFIDSMQIDRFLAKEEGDDRKHSLDSVSQHYGIEKDENAHNALSDTLQTVKVFEKQIVQLGGVDSINKELEEHCHKGYINQREYWKRKNNQDYNNYFGY